MMNNDHKHNKDLIKRHRRNTAVIAGPSIMEVVRETHDKILDFPLELSSEHIVESDNFTKRKNQRHLRNDTIIANDVDGKTVLWKANAKKAMNFNMCLLGEDDRFMSDMTSTTKRDKTNTPHHQHNNTMTTDMGDKKTMVMLKEDPQATDSSLDLDTVSKVNTRCFSDDNISALSVEGYKKKPYNHLAYKRIHHRHVDPLNMTITFKKHEDSTTTTKSTLVIATCLSEHGAVRENVYFWGDGM